MPIPARLSIGGCAAALLSLLLVSSPAMAEDVTTPETVVVDKDVASQDDFDSAPVAVERSLAADVVEESADMGVLVDSAAIDVQQAPGIGFIAGTPDALASVESVTRVDSEVHEDGKVIAQDAAFAMREAPSTAADDPPLPLGPGALGLKFFPREPCKFLYGSERGNVLTSCFTLGYLDNGDGRHGYGVRDDDGSAQYDWFTYHQWGSVSPSDQGFFDWNIQSASKRSYITAGTVAAGSPGITDYAPNANSCDGSLSMGLNAFAFDFSGTLCTSGKDIILIDEYGSFGQKLDIKLIAPSDPRSLDYRVAIRIKQGVRPDWYTVNSATFRKNVSTTTNTIRGVTD